jgi:hypothetical protein
MTAGSGAPARAALLVAIATAVGCTSVQPDRVVIDRMDYGQVIAESWKRQTLLNVVRMRYGDAPVFLDVSSVINSYSLAGKANAAASLPSAVDPNVLSFGAEGTWSNTPTVTYQPLIGDRFTRSLLHPIAPSAIFQMLQAGWAADLVMSTVINSINGLRNDSFGAAGDPGFHELITTLARIQRAGGLAIRVEARKDGNAVIVVVRSGDGSAARQNDQRRIRELLKLDADAGEFEVTYGLAPRNGREVALLSRSMLEIMLNLGIGVELPAAHIDAGRAAPWPASAGPAPVEIRIHSSSAAPSETYAAVPYKGSWYWIDDTDIASKRAFTFLMILFSLAETGQSVTAPVVTVPSR